MSQLYWRFLSLLGHLEHKISPTYVVLHDPLRGDAVLSVAAATPALVFSRVAPEHPVASHCPALALYADTADAIFQIAGSAIDHLKCETN